MSRLLISARASESTVGLTRLDARLLGITLLALCTRALLLQELMYAFLLWNLVLAYVPLALCRVHEGLGRHWGLSGEVGLVGAWLLFLPNAPYILTDFVHPITAAARGHYGGLWLGTLATGAAAALGVYCFVRCLRYFDGVLDARGVSAQGRALACGGVVGASAVGVWLGRLLRFNTWDVLASPLALARETLAFLGDAGHLELVAVTALLLWGCWRGYARYRWLGECLR